MVTGTTTSTEQTHPVGEVNPRFKPVVVAALWNVTKQLMLYVAFATKASTNCVTSAKAVVVDCCVDVSLSIVGVKTAIGVFVTEVTCPWAFVVKTGICDAEPYVPAVPVLAILNVKLGDSFSPVPAV